MRRNPGGKKFISLKAVLGDGRGEMLIKYKFSIKSKGVCAERKIHDSFNFLFSCIILSTRFTRKFWEMTWLYAILWNSRVPEN